MKTKTTKLIVAAFLLAWTATAQINVPQPSSAGSVFSKVGLTDVTIDYFRPKVKGRKIFGKGDDYLLPFGKLWRAGANSGSKLTLSTGATIGGKQVEAGEYLIFITPNSGKWKFMLYSDLSIGGNVSGYDPSKEVLAVEVDAVKLSSPVEILTYNISDISEDNTSANIQMAWENYLINVPVKVDFDEEVMKEIAANTQVNPRNYVDAANYYLTANKDLEQALKWIEMYLAIGQNANQFWHVHTKARILAAMGKKKDAITTAEDSLSKAKKSERGDFGYIKRNEDLIASMK